MAKVAGPWGHGLRDLRIDHRGIVLGIIARFDTGFGGRLDFGFYLVKFIDKAVIQRDGFFEAFNLLGDMFTEFGVGICGRTGRCIGGTDRTS